MAEKGARSGPRATGVVLLLLVGVGSIGSIDRTFGAAPVLAQSTVTPRSLPTVGATATPTPRVIVITRPTSTPLPAPAETPPPTPPATAIPTPSPTSVVSVAEPAATLVPTPIPTAAPLPTPLPTLAPTLAVIPTIAPSSVSRMTFSAEDWAGGFYRGDELFYGRPWVAVYGALSAYPRATLAFSLNGEPSGPATLRVTGLDDEWAEFNPIVVELNGSQVFTGLSPFFNWDGVGNGADAAWTQVPIPLPADLLRAGRNEIAIANLTPSGNFNAPPYLLLGDATIDAPGTVVTSVAPDPAPEPDRPRRDRPRRGNAGGNDGGGD